MKLRDKIKQSLIRWILKENPVGKIIVSDGSKGQESVAHDTDQRSHVKVFLVNVYAYSAQRAIARDVSSTPVLIQKRKSVAGISSWVTIDKGPLVDLLEAPNPSETWEQLTERVVLLLLGTGNGYYLYDPTGKELYTCRSDWIKINVDSDGRLVGYEASNEGIKTNLAFDDVVHVKLSSPTGDFYGFPPSETIKKTILTKISLNDYLNAFFENNATPGLVMSVPGALDPDQKEQARKVLKRFYSRHESFNSLIVEKGASITRVSPDIKDLVPREIDDMVMREVLAAYGVPPVKIGILDGATYANANKQDQIYERSTCEPIRRLIEQSINLQLVRNRFGKDYRIHYDRSKVLGLQEDENERVTRVLNIYNSGVSSLNEARENVGLDPINEIDGSLRKEPAQGSPDDKTELPSRFKSGDPDYKKWEIFYKKVKAGEKTLTGILQEFFDSQLDRIIENLEDISFGDEISRALLWSRCIMKAPSPNVGDAATRIFDEIKEADLLHEAMDPIIRRYLEKAAADSFTEIAIEGSFDLHNPLVQEVFDKFHNRITGISDHTYSEVKRIIQRVYDDGSPLSEAVSELRDLYAGFSKVRAKRIAQTEITGATNGGNLLGYKQAGAEKKKWICAFVPDSRGTHRRAHGTEIPIHDDFIVGGYPMECPGDPSAPAREVVNCYCTLNAS